MKKATIKYSFAIFFTLFSVLDSFGQFKINENFFLICDFSRSWGIGQKPGEYNRTPNRLKFQFNPNKIEVYLLKGTFNFRWELLETHTISYSEIRKDDEGTPIYLYGTSNNYQIAVNRDSFKRVIIMGGSKNIECLSD